MEPTNSLLAGLKMEFDAAEDPQENCAYTNARKSREPDHSGSNHAAVSEQPSEAGFGMFGLKVENKTKTSDLAEAQDPFKALNVQVKKEPVSDSGDDTSDDVTGSRRPDRAAVSEQPSGAGFRMFGLKVKLKTKTPDPDLTEAKDPFTALNLQVKKEPARGSGDNIEGCDVFFANTDLDFNHGDSNTNNRMSISASSNRIAKRGRGGRGRGRGCGGPRARGRGRGSRGGTGGGVRAVGHWDVSSLERAEEQQARLQGIIHGQSIEELRRLALQMAVAQPGLIFDLVHPETVSGYQPSPNSEAPSWCICTRCKPMPTLEERICCGRTRCLSLKPEMRIIVHPFVLHLSRKQRQDILVFDDEMEENASNRHAAYRQFIFWQQGRLGAGTRRVIPSCCVWAIRDKYPSAQNVYSGYRPAQLQ